VILPPRRGGTYLYCPACPRWRTRTLRQYARHWERRHHFHHAARIIAGAGEVYVAACGTQLHQPGWVELGYTPGYGISFPPLTAQRAGG
jgi:hypothetical protein